MTHPFNLPDPEGQAARDKAKPMANINCGDTVMNRTGSTFPILSEHQAFSWRNTFGQDRGIRRGDIIAALDAEGRVIRTADGPVAPNATTVQALQDARDELAWRASAGFRNTSGMTVKEYNKIERIAAITMAWHEGKQRARAAMKKIVAELEGGQE